MKKSEKAYLIVALVYSLLWAAVFVFWVHRYLAGVDRPASGFIAIINLAMTLSIMIPSVVGLRSQRLTLLGSIVQFVFLMMSIYGIPVAVWGMVLLRKSLKSQANVNNRPEATADTPAPQP